MSPPNDDARGWQEWAELWLDVFRGYDALGMSADVAATLAATLLGLVALVLTAVHESRGRLATRLDAVEVDVAELKRGKS